MWQLGIWFSVGLDGVSFMVGSDDLKDSSQPKWFHDSTLFLVSTKTPRSFSAKLLSNWVDPTVHWCLELFFPGSLYFSLLNFTSLFLQPAELGLGGEQYSYNRYDLGTTWEICQSKALLRCLGQNISDAVMKQAIKLFQI